MSKHLPHDEERITGRRLPAFIPKLDSSLCKLEWVLFQESMMGSHSVTEDIYTYGGCRFDAAGDTAYEKRDDGRRRFRILKGVSLLRTAKWSGSL